MYKFLLKRKDRKPMNHVSRFDPNFSSFFSLNWYNLQFFLMKLKNYRIQTMVFYFLIVIRMIRHRMIAKLYEVENVFGAHS